MCAFGYVCGYLHMTAGVCDRQKRLLDPLLGCILGLGIAQYLPHFIWASLYVSRPWAKGELRNCHPNAYLLFFS